jgi:hypothetical protein
MKLVNLTPHAITIGNETLEPSGTVARVTMEEMDAEPIGGIPCISRIASGVTGIPSPAPDTVYVVSAMVLAATDRADIVAPDTGSTAIRDDAGRIQSVTRLVCNQGE